MSRALRWAWVLAVALAAGLRVWTALEGPLLWGFDAGGHVQYVCFLDAYRALPWADQGWSLFHPPLHYLLGWILAQARSAELLMRGLVLLSSAASLAMAFCVVWLVRGVSPGRPLLGLVAFAAVAFLPAQLAASSMPGNELTQSALATAALVSFVANQRRASPSLAGDLRTGLLLGLALLTKHNALVTLVALCAALVGLGLLAVPGRAGGLRTLQRLAVMAGVALALAAPIYVRNVQAFGTPVPSAADHVPLVRLIERSQGPGSRSLADYLRFPLKLFSEPDREAPHLLHSVWGSLYVSAWNVESPGVPQPANLRALSLLVVLGLLPTGLALAGAGAAIADVWRGHRRELYLPLLALCVVGGAAAVAFSLKVPTWGALKASYLMPLSLAYAVFLCRALEPLPRRLAAPALVGLGLVAAACAAVSFWGVQRAGDLPSLTAGPVYYYFGEYEAARRVFERRLELDPGEGKTPPMLLDSLGSVELADGRPAQALELFERGEARSAYGRIRIANARALDGDLSGARAILDALVAHKPSTDALTNRGAVRAAQGDLEGAQADLEAAVGRAPDLMVAWFDLAEVRERMGRFPEAAQAYERARQQACTGPRGYPYAVGGGTLTLGHRMLLVWDELGLRPALPAFYRGACGTLESPEL